MAKQNQKSIRCLLNAQWCPSLLSFPVGLDRNSWFWSECLSLFLSLSVLSQCEEKRELHTHFKRLTHVSCWDHPCLPLPTPPPSLLQLLWMSTLLPRISNTHPLHPAIWSTCDVPCAAPKVIIYRSSLMDVVLFNFLLYHPVLQGGCGGLKVHLWP